MTSMLIHFMFSICSGEKYKVKHTAWDGEAWLSTCGVNKSRNVLVSGEAPLRQTADLQCCCVSSSPSGAFQEFRLKVSVRIVWHFRHLNVTSPKVGKQPTVGPNFVFGLQQNLYPSPLRCSTNTLCLSLSLLLSTPLCPPAPLPLPLF